MATVPAHPDKLRMQIVCLQPVSHYLTRSGTWRWMAVSAKNHDHSRPGMSHQFGGSDTSEPCARALCTRAVSEFARDALGVHSPDLHQAPIEVAIHHTHQGSGTPRRRTDGRSPETRAEAIRAIANAGIIADVQQAAPTPAVTLGAWSMPPVMPVTSWCGGPCSLPSAGA